MPQVTKISAQGLGIAVSCVWLRSELGRDAELGQQKQSTEPGSEQGSSSGSLPWGSWPLETIYCIPELSVFTSLLLQLSFRGKLHP